MKRNKLLDYIIVILIILLILIIFYKFFFKKKYNIIEINNLKKIVLKDFNNKEYSLKGIIKDECYLLIFSIDDCGTCIDKGIYRLKYFYDKGKNAIGIIIHGNISEIKNWPDNYKFKKFYFINKELYYKYFKNEFTPLLFYMKNNEVVWYKYITP